MADTAPTAARRPAPRIRLASPWRTVRLGMKSLWMHRLRSLLTVLGIVFGVCSVIAMLAVGEGASHEAQEQIRRLGSNNILLKSVKPTEQQRVTTERSYVIEYGLTYLDMERIRQSIPGVTVVVPGRVIRERVWNATRRMDAEIVGAVPWYPEMRNLTITDGRFFTEDEMRQMRNVCVLSEPMVPELFPLTPAIGANVRVGGSYYKVIGVISQESTVVPSAAAGNGEANGAAGGRRGESSATPRMYIPLTAAKSRFGEVLVRRTSGSFEAERVELHEAIVKVDSQDQVEETARIVGEILSRNRKKNDWEMLVPLELLRQAERTKQIFNTVLGAIAAISLIVGGIGIMNIMLASVTERTREIGIRRALGAKRRDIVVQFLVETVILSGAGGVIGVILGLIIPWFISRFADMATIVTPWAPIIAFSISASVGLVFGIYPALRAANMDPVEALRHE
ncbi:MAG: ABC transporter permease [Candidatus Hydrogenedentes bacterium]|nr:ABC transporter permease [Candidatus Hydrogenedentota bacterium]